VRVLSVSEKFPWPVDDGGQIRAWRILKAMARELDVTLVALAPPRPEDVAPAEALGVRVVTLPNERTSTSNALHAAAALVTRRPSPLGKNWSRPLLDAVRRELAAGDVSSLHLNQIDTAQYLAELGPVGPGRPPAVFETQNVLTTMYRRLFETATGLRRAYCAVQARKMARYEPELMRGFDLVTVCSEIEAAWCREPGVERVAVIPNGVDTTAFAPEPTPRAPGERPTLVFTGAMSYLPNREGLEWFLDRVAPLVERKVGDFRVLVVGKDPPPGLRERARPGRLELTGWVDDVRAPMRSAEVSVVPLRIGGGTRIKILEALALGVPVVSTRVGAEGLDVTHGRDILLADEPEPMAAAIAELLTSPARRTALAQAGRALVVERYDWDAVVAPLARWHADLAGASNRRA
jgi:glycosyltransferase involved in cell wall biosynthesis